MTASARLETYVEAFTKRLKLLHVTRGAVVISILALVISVIGAMLAIRAGFANDVVISTRLVLLLSLGVAAYCLVFLPIKRIDEDSARDIEARTPEFSGRVETYLNMDGSGNPLQDLLAEDTMEIAQNYPAVEQIKQKELALPTTIASICLIILIWLVITGPGLLNYGIRHLWAGWAFSNLLPPQNIVVTPGDQLVRRGASFKVEAQPEGFDPLNATVSVRIGDGDWQEVEMVRIEQGFEFIFFSVREPVNYFVSTAGIRSPSYKVNVIDLPNIENLKLTYHYPEWTSLEVETFDPGGDIRALSGTGIDLEVSLDAPIPELDLVLNGANSELKIDGQLGQSHFEVTEDGQYYIAANVGGEQVRLSDDYFITIIEDGKPKIRIIHPGRDWNASSIEEVTTRVEATDDFKLDSLELRYSVNGGKWQSIPLLENGEEELFEHVFLLEEMQSEIADIQNEGESKFLVPGDLISYYAIADDRQQTTRTDMFFIEVQPFNRRYSQSQQAGGGGGGGGQGETEISQRQKEIIVSTWNLIREQSKQDSTTEDNAMLLSELQTTLAKQAQTLADRTKARELVLTDEKIAYFVENLESAVEAMHPAAERLAEIDLEEAIRPEQESLQHLLRAEATFNDIQVSFQRGGGGGGGRQAGRDLAEMFELEMDLEKNQYETGNSASGASQSEQADDAMRQLEELARRQEQLANNMSQRNNPTPAQRWQQEMLRREAEELQQRLQDMQQQASNQQSSQQSGQQSSSQQGGQQGEGNQNRGELDRRLQSAIRAMNEAIGSSGNTDQSQRAAQEAQRQLEGARDQIASEQHRSMVESFDDMSEQARRMYDDQVQIEQELQDAMRRALSEMASKEEDDTELPSGLSRDEEVELARKKQELATQLQDLQADMRTAARQFTNDEPNASRELERSSRKLKESEIEKRISTAARYIDIGAAPYVAASESVVTDGLRELKDNLRQARSMLGGEGQEVNDLDRALSQTQQLRQELQRIANGAGQQQQAGNGEGQRQQGGNEAGQQQGGPRGGSRQTGGGGDINDIWDAPFRDFIGVTPEIVEQIRTDVSDAGQLVRRAIPELRRQGLSEEQLNRVRELLSQLELSQFTGNEAILQQEFNAVLTLAEQLELQLASSLETDAPANVRTRVAEPVPNEYKEAIAEYYRRLSRDSDSNE